MRHSHFHSHFCSFPLYTSNISTLFPFPYSSFLFASRHTLVRFKKPKRFKPFWLVLFGGSVALQCVVQPRDSAFSHNNCLQTSGRHRLRIRSTPSQVLILPPYPMLTTTPHWLLAVLPLTHFTSSSSADIQLFLHTSLSYSTPTLSLPTHSFITHSFLLFVSCFIPYQQTVSKLLDKLRLLTSPSYQIRKTSTTISTSLSHWLPHLIIAISPDDHRPHNRFPSPPARRCTHPSFHNHLFIANE